MSVQDPKRTEAFAVTQGQVGRGDQTSSGLLFEEAGGGSETDVYQDVVAGF